MADGHPSRLMVGHFVFPFGFGEEPAVGVPAEQIRFALQPLVAQMRSTQNVPKPLELSVGDGRVVEL